MGGEGGGEYNSNLESVSGMRVSGVGGGVWSERGSGGGGGGGGGTARVSQGGERVQSHPLILVHLLCQLQHTHTHTQANGNHLIGKIPKIHKSRNLNV